MIVRLCDPVQHPSGTIRAVTLQRVTAETAERILSMRGHLDLTAEGSLRFLAIAVSVLCGLPLELAARLSSRDVVRIGELIAEKRGTTRGDDDGDTHPLPMQIN